MDEDINDAQREARDRLSANLKSFRGKKHLSQEALADRAGLHRTFVSQVERKIVNVSLDNLVLLAQALEVTLTDLFRETRDEHAQPAEKASEGSADRGRRRKAD